MVTWVFSFFVDGKSDIITGQFIADKVPFRFQFILDSLSSSCIDLGFYKLICNSSRNMSLELCPERPLFGGSISSSFPQRFEDASNIRPVPDHQEVFVDPSRDESLIFELLDFKSEVADNGSASWFLDDLACEQHAQGFKLIEQSDVIVAPELSYRNIPAVVTTAVGEMAISKGRQGREAQNLVRVYVANIRLKGVETDVLVTAYEPILINPLSESANDVGSGLAVAASQSGILPMCDVIKQSLSTFKVNDWSLFGSSA